MNFSEYCKYIQSYIPPVKSSSFLIILLHQILISDGFSYEREALEEWFDRGRDTSPMTNLELSPEVIENSVLRERIESFLHDMDFDAITFEQNEEE